MQDLLFVDPDEHEEMGRGAFPKAHCSEGIDSIYAVIASLSEDALGFPPGLSDRVFRNGFASGGHGILRPTEQPDSLMVRDRHSEPGGHLNPADVPFIFIKVEASDDDGHELSVLIDNRMGEIY